MIDSVGALDDSADLSDAADILDATGNLISMMYEYDEADGEEEFSDLLSMDSSDERIKSYIQNNAGSSKPRDKEGPQFICKGLPESVKFISIKDAYLL